MQSTEPWSRRFFRKKMYFPVFFCFFCGFQSQIRRMQKFSRLARPVIDSSVAMCTYSDTLFKSRYFSCCASLVVQKNRVSPECIAGELRPPPPPRHRWRTGAGALCDTRLVTLILLFKLPNCLFSLVAAWPTQSSHRHESKLGRDDTRPSPRG